jgi:uncharacterized protein (TIRG00374 family)
MSRPDAPLTGRPLRLPTLSTRTLLSYLALGLLLGLGVLALAAWGADLDAIWDGLVRADPRWVVLALLTIILTTLFKVARWQHLFPRAARPGFLPLARALLIGQVANALLPARVGDLARAGVAGASERTSAAAALGTIAVEKASDLVCLLLAGLFAASVAPLPGWADWTLFGLVGGGLVAVLGALARSEGHLTRWAERWIVRLPGKMGTWALDTLTRLLSGLRALRNPGMAGRLCLLSTAIWLLAASTNYCLFHAFGLSLSVGAACFLLVVLHLGVAPPSTPGKIGVFHALVVLGLDVLGVDRALGLAYAAVLHALVYLPQIVLGVASLFSGRWPSRSVT